MREKALALGLRPSEYDLILEHLGREPNLTEVGMYAALWSEHCAYKHSRSHFKRFPTKGSHILQGPGENAGVIDIGDGQAVVMKVESHNHPSAVEPYQGAATGVGGILRDIFAMGARPIACLNSLRFGPLSDDRTRFLVSGIVSGIAGYGNCTGVPTVGGEVQFDECYAGNPLVNVMCVGLVDTGHIARAAALGEGNAVLVAGARTGRDGILGASFASAELDDHSEERRPAVQVGDPFTEKLLIEATLEVIRRGLAIGVQDMGAAGLTSSACEMAARAGTGIDLDLLKVLRRESGITPYEMMLSESQERMLLVVTPDKQREVIDIYHRWGVDCTAAGRVTGDGLLRIREGDAVVAEVPAWSLSTDGAPSYVPEAYPPEDPAKAQAFSCGEVPLPDDYSRCLLQLLSSPGIACKEWIYRQYDHMVQTNTVLPPGSDAALLRVKGTRKAIALSMDGNGRYCRLDPKRGAMIAVAESARNVACCGARPLAITDGLNYGNPEKPDVYWQFVQGVEGIAQACAALETPVVGGNVSFYNETNGESVFPTPIIGMLGLLDDVARRCDTAFKSEGDLVVLLGATFEELGGSEYLKVCHGKVAGLPPGIDMAREKGLIDLLVSLIADGLLQSAHDLSEGGLAVAAAECCIQGSLGAGLTLAPGEIRPDAILFGESQGRVLVSVKPESLQAVLDASERGGLPATVLGCVGGSTLQIGLTDSGVPVLSLIQCEVEELKQAWKGSIACQMAKD